MSSQSEESPVNPPRYEEVSVHSLDLISQTSDSVPTPADFTLPTSTPLQKPPPALSSVSTLNTSQIPRLSTPVSAGRLAYYDEESYARAQVKEEQKGKKIDGFSKIMCFGVAVAGVILCCTPLCCR
jgi:preprotein translocase subunit Sec61beta